MRIFCTTTLGLFLFISVSAQKNISIEDIWQDYTFYSKSVPGFNFLNDGQHYSVRDKNKIQKYDLKTGESVGVLLDGDEIEGLDKKVDGYTFSNDESKILIKTETERIYRHSTRANFYVWDGTKAKALFTPGKQRYATFSPSGSHIAFVHQNDIYLKNLKTDQIERLTDDGKFNHIINGATDWVYEEEFAFDRAFEWNADGTKIAYIKFDESRVREFTMVKHTNDGYPEYETFKYPKVGEKNAVVSVHIYDLSSKKTVPADTGNEVDQYIPRIKWSKDPKNLFVYRMNRHQNHLEILSTNADLGSTSVLFEEKNKYYIDITDDITFLEDGKHFIWTSEKSGYNHIYLYSMDGKEKRKLSSGKYDVTAFYGVDEQNSKVYYQSAEQSPLQRHIYSVNIKGRNKKQITMGEGWNSAQFSSTFAFYVNNRSTLNSAPTYSVHDNTGKKIRVIEDNQSIRGLQKEFGVSKVEFFDFKTSEGVTLNGWQIKPSDFDSKKEYPVFMYLYGGPGSQQVSDRWKGSNYWWFQMLAQKGYVVVCVDNRGTGARGEEFKKMTYLQLGKYETIDQIEAAKYIGAQSWADASRIGIFGWSYGGYMSTLCLLKGNDTFKAAIAVAPVTNWKWYDTIYTERYMRTYAENKEGYDENSPVNFADHLKGNYLIIHGNADDNVHFQNTAEMANALIKAGKQFDTYFYPNRNHGIYGGNTRHHLYTKMTNFVLEKI